MVDELRNRIASMLGEYRICVVCARDNGDVRAIPVRYRSSGLAVFCIIPRWTDVSFHLQTHSNAFLTVQAGCTHGLRWLELEGEATEVSLPVLHGILREPEHRAIDPDLYAVFQVSPRRIAYINEENGWGAREILDVDPIREHQ